MRTDRRSAEALAAALRVRGVHRIECVRYKVNRTRLLSVSRDGATLHAHACFNRAPEDVVDAIAEFLLRERGSPGHARAVECIRRWAASAVAGGATESPEPRPGPCSATPAQRRYLAEAYRRLNAERFGGVLPETVPIRLSRRMTRRLGHVRCHRRADGERVVVELALNPDLMLEGNEAELRATLLHEMAHVEAWLLHGHRGHGAVWKRIARRVGCEPRACTRAPVRRRRRGTPVPTRVPPTAPA